MSETFLIKKTAFNDNSNDIAQHQLDSFIIGPGELNGPGGTARDSDLRLYGFGSLKWGEGVDQNLYRLLENNACPRKEPGDPGYDPVNPKPKDEGDLGIGNGISNPVVGQNWFDTTVELEFLYTASGIWRTTSGLDASGNLNVTGNLTVGGTICGFINPDGSTDTGSDACAMTRGYADDRYVNVTGDTMTGQLNLTANLNMNNNRIINLLDPNSNDDAISRGYADGRYLNSNGDTMTGQLNLTANLNMNNNRVFNVGNPNSGDDAMSRDYADNRYVLRNGGTLTANLNMQGNRIINLANATSGADAVSRNFGDGRYVEVNGGTQNMYGELHMKANIDMNNNKKIRNLQNPSSAQDAATKDYVDGRTPLSKEFNSGERAIPSKGTIETWNHGLGGKPSAVYVAFRCKTSEYGYSVGEEIRLPAFTAINSGNLEGVSISLTSTQVRVIFGNSNNYLRAARANATIGSIIELTPSRWRIVVKAWL